MPKGKKAGRTRTIKARRNEFCWVGGGEPLVPAGCLGTGPMSSAQSDRRRFLRPLETRNHCAAVESIGRAFDETRLRLQAKTR